MAGLRQRSVRGPESLGRMSRIGSDGGFANDDGVGEDDGVRYYDALTFGCGNDRGAGLNVFDAAFQAGDVDPVADFKRFLHQDKDAGEEILEDILEREADGHAADAKHFYEVRGMEGRRDGGDGGENAYDDDAQMRQLTQQQA